jgi:hypothetical protein
MSKYNNIDDLFKDKFSDHLENPSDKIWEGIQPKLVGPRLEMLYRTAFKGFTSSPSQAVWRKIAAGLWFKNFVHFSPFTFNAYYMAALSVIGTVSIVSYNNYNTNNFSLVETEKYAQIELQEITKVQENVIENISNKVMLASVDNNLGIIPFNNVQKRNVSNSTPYKGSDFYLDANTQSQNQSQIVQNQIVEAEIQNETSLNNIAKTKHNLFKLSHINFSNIAISSDLIDLSKNAFSNYGIKDIAIYDTLGVDYKGDDIILKRSYSELSLWAAVHNSKLSLSTQNSEIKNQVEELTDMMIVEDEYSVGINYAYNYKNLHFETGIQYNYLKEKLSKTNSVLDIIDNSYYEHFTNSFWQIDTVSYILDLDEYLNGNEVYVPYIDSIQIHYQDSSLISIIDTIDNTQNISVNNQYHIVGVPLIAGYEFNLGKFSLTPKTGIITGLLIKREGQTFDLIDHSIIDVDINNHPKFLFDYYAALNFKYNLYHKSYIFIEPHVRSSINNINNSSVDISKKNLRYGINLGVALRF